MVTQILLDNKYAKYITGQRQSGVRSSGILCSVDWYFGTDFSGQTVFALDYMSLENGTHKFPETSVSN